MKIVNVFIFGVLVLTLVFFFRVSFGLEKLLVEGWKRLSRELIPTLEFRAPVRLGDQRIGRLMLDS